MKLIININKNQGKILTKKAELSGYKDEMKYLQFRIDEILKEDRRLEHIEK